MHTRRIMKFGGTSMASADTFKRVAEIIEKNIELNPVIVVSALGVTGDHIKITDALLGLGKSALEGKEEPSLMESFCHRHREIIDELNLDQSILQECFENLNAVLVRIRQGGYGSPGEALDALAGLGEVFSARIMAEFLSGRGLPFIMADPAEFGFITTDRFQNADVLDESLEKIACAVIASRKLLVFPGYIGVTADGRPTTLGRGGSDYTGAVLGASLKRDVEIWTDVSGVYRIGPAFLPRQFRDVGHPETIPHLSYDEAFQMSAFGSRVLYRKTLNAVYQAVKKGKHIRLIIKNTFDPEHAGTVVSGQKQNHGNARGITVLEGTQLLNIYPDSQEQVSEFLESARSVENADVVLASSTWGRVSAVFDRYVPELSELENRFNGHLSRDQVLVKVVGDGLGENSRLLSMIHNALQSAESPEKYGMNLVHKSPQLLTDNTFEFLVKKRGLSDVILTLYKALFMTDILTVGLLGMGTVGAGVLEYCSEMYSPEKGGFSIRFPVALVRDPARTRNFEFRGRFSNNVDEILDDPLVDVVMELIGGIEPARTYILSALNKGKDVVTANKALLAEHGAEIFETADRNRRNIGFEASVCAEIPIIDDFLKFPGLSDIEGIEGIVNGTSNYVLSRFMEGMSFDTAVKKAQELGFAEADPTMDISGADAVQKLSILASILFNMPINHRDIPRQGIDGLSLMDLKAFEIWGMVIKPLAMAKIMDGRLNLRVSPALIQKTHPLATVRDENNALSLYLKGRREPITKIGKGAGAIPTARSVVRDLLDVSRKSRAYMADVPRFYKSRGALEVAGRGSISAGWYMRLSVKDNPGVFGKIATILGDFGISIRRVLQEETQESPTAGILLELKPTAEENIQKSADVLTRLPFIEKIYHCIIQ